MDITALRELFKQQDRVSEVLCSFGKEYAQSVASGRQDAWFKAVRSYVDFVEAFCTPIERRKDTSR